MEGTLRARIVQRPHKLSSAPDWYLGSFCGIEHTPVNLLLLFWQTRDLMGNIPDDSGDENNPLTFFWFL
jgi:hypothetical protein